ncbi:transferase hexapeptide (six repeat-containing protein) [Bacillus sp. OV166]|uniref:acyltransferase n=1 Tax=Bacillus sp. OV166 TaxID=1882763 RepID=UPI000A2AA4F5|nr:acyltransferase [Bacillus sp. OV166]SMQ84297.1 transferase hexapeptide (six repeat-containing protein) [Bacillus sp. OV166]
MEIINETNQIEDLKENNIIGNPKLTNSKIIFRGKGNVLYCDNDDVHLVNSTIQFSGNESIIFLCKNRHNYLFNATVYNNCVLFFGKDNYFNSRLNIIISEQKNIIVGEDCLISFDCWFRTADPHLIYDSNTKKRINPSRSIYIGDHVWIGQHAFILKGTQIGSGSIIGGMSVVSGKKIGSNCSYAGNPARKISESIFYSSDSVHSYREEETRSHEVFESDEYIYSYNQTELFPFSSIEKSLTELKLVSEKLDFIKLNLQMNRNKNRFFIEKSMDKQSFIKRIKNMF